MSEPVHALVFSKDRAMQLDGFLRSAERYAPYASVTVLIGNIGSNFSRHQRSYELLETKHESVEFWGDASSLGFEGVVRHWLKRHERVVFHTDDELFYAAPPAELLGQADDVIPVFRQGRNTTWCQVLDEPQAVPDTFPVWRWAEAEHDFGYPLSLNGCVYWSRDILPLLDFSFANPTQLEAGLATRADRLRPQWMAAGTHSCTVALPHNVVSVDSGCPRGSNPNYQPDALCELFLDGWRIDLDAMDFLNIVAAHQEVPLVFRRAV